MKSNQHRLYVTETDRDQLKTLRDELIAIKKEYNRETETYRWLAMATQCVDTSIATSRTDGEYKQ